MLINEGFQDCVRQSSSAWKKSAFASFRISLGAQLLELVPVCLKAFAFRHAPLALAAIDYISFDLPQQCLASGCLRRR
ncbi:hypothetical protein OKW39_004635 [Paraburkholderia sp. MM6662-R1]